MAFTIQNWSRLSASANEPITTVQIDPLPAPATLVGCFRKYGYYSPLDNQVATQVAGYFNNLVAGGGVAYDLVTDDVIEVFSAIENTLVKLRVTNTAGVITTAVLA